MTTLTLPEFALRRALEDTGVFARHVMEFDYDEDDEGGVLARRRINVGHGGIRSTGAHKQMTDFLDAAPRLKHLEAPRESLKTCAMGAFALRLCLANPGFKVLWAMQTKDFAIQKVDEVVKSKCDDPESRLRHYFGDMRGAIWTRDRLTFRNGSSITVTGVDSSKTGGHYHLVMGDDLVDTKNSETPEGITKVQTYFEMLFPMLLPGGIMVITGTRYHEADLYGHMLANLQEEFSFLILDAGFDAVRTDTGWRLEGEARFPHLSEKRLLSRLRTMGYERFCSQYLNKIVSGMRAPFTREQFQPVRKQDLNLGDLTGYVFVDSATSLKEQACHSAVALVGLDGNDNAYLIDLTVGHLDTWQLTGAVLAMCTKWDAHLTVQACCWENISLNTVFRAIVEKAQKEKGIRVNHVGIPRGTGEPSKIMRIKSLQPRFEDRRFFVVDTVPRYFQDLNDRKLLWDPEGYRNPTDPRVMPLPDGELVRQFVSFPRSKRMDISDALADLDRAMPDGTRYCQHMPSASRRYHTRTKSALRVGKVVMMPSFQGESWYERKARELGFTG